MKWPVRMSGTVAHVQDEAAEGEGVRRDVAAAHEAAGERHHGLADARRVGVLESHAGVTRPRLREYTVMASGTPCGAIP